AGHLRQRHGRIELGVRLTGEDLHVVPQPCQPPAQMLDVDALPAAVRFAPVGQQGYAHGTVLLGTRWRPDDVIIRPAEEADAAGSIAGARERGGRRRAPTSLRADKLCPDDLLRALVVGDLAPGQVRPPAPPRGESVAQCPVRPWCMMSGDI